LSKRPAAHSPHTAKDTPKSHEWIESNT
jgi:hypothetical protein